MAERCTDPTPTIRLSGYDRDGRRVVVVLEVNPKTGDVFRRVTIPEAV